MDQGISDQEASLRLLGFLLFAMPLALLAYAIGVIVRAGPWLVAFVAIGGGIGCALFLVYESWQQHQRRAT